MYKQMIKLQKSLIGIKLCYYSILQINPQIKNSPNNKISALNVNRKYSVKINNHIKEKKIALGVNFKYLATTSSAFSDKTLFIKEILKDTDEVVLITMPRRWGKSINLDMLRRFLEKKVDKNENEISSEENDNYELFFGDGKNLNPLDIANTKLQKNIKLGITKTNPKQVFGTFPVIYLDFISCYGESYHIVKDKLGDSILKIYHDHKYLLNSNKQLGSKTIGDEYDKYLKLIENRVDSAIQNGLYNLSYLLHKHFNQKVWILIDEYDKPVSDAYMYFKDFGEAHRISRLIRSILEPALKNNENLAKAS